MGKIIGAQKGEPNKPTKVLAVLGIVIIVVAVFIGGFYLFTYIQGLVIAPTPGVDTTTFVGTAYVSGEDVSSHAHIKIMVLKDTVENPDSDDIRTYSNYEEGEAVDDIEDISIDLSEIPYYIIVFNPVGDQYWATTYQLEFGMSNVADKELILYHQASDVEGNVIDSLTMDEWDLSSDIENGLVILDVPHNSTLEQYYGDNWDMSTADYDDLDADDKLFYKDQAKFRCEFPTYDPSDDSDKDGQDELELVTNVFAIEFTFNATISLVDGATTQVNMTINDNSPIELAYSATKIYMLFHRVIDFKNGAYSVAFDIALNTHINATSVKSVRIPVPYETSSLGTPVVLSTFPL